MMIRRDALGVTLVGLSLVALAGCSINGMLWGPEGARVIDVTEMVIADASAGETNAYVCEGSVVVFGEAGMWAGVSAGEPERVTFQGSPERSTPDATWRINLEGAAAGSASGDSIPTDVFYRETKSGLCVVDVIWHVLDVG